MDEVRGVRLYFSRGERLFFMRLDLKMFYGLGLGVGDTVAVPGRKSNFGGGGETTWNPNLSVNVKYVT
jgi:hypothetical protein